MAQELCCIHCGRSIGTHSMYGRQAYKKHVLACANRTPAERIKANQQAARNLNKRLNAVLRDGRHSPYGEDIQQ